MILPMLFILLLGLKLAGVIAWPWWLVLLPLVVMVARWAFLVALKEAVKLNRPWAVKFIAWLKS